MRIRILASAIMAGLLCAAPHAGNANPPSTKANAQIASPAQAYDALLSNCEQVMVGVAKAMPADKYDFTPASLGIANFKFTGIRTFAEQVKHVAQQNYVFFSDVGRMQPDVDVDCQAEDQGRYRGGAGGVLRIRAQGRCHADNRERLGSGARSSTGDACDDSGTRDRPRLQSSRPARRV
jgi:hypothetical protein